MARVRGVMRAATEAGSISKRIGFDVGKDRRGAFIERRVGGGREGDGRHDDFVARAHRRCARMAQCRAAVPELTATPSRRAAMGGKGLFEFGDPGPVVSQPETSASTTALMSASAISCRP